jgi:glycosyltransferase involved in cell wall biosynthesis
LKPLRYALITPVRNEAQFIEGTIRSVLAQTHRPERWVIVSDGSTDGTDEIIGSYLADNPWIEFLRMPERDTRHFAGKVHSFDAGYSRIRDEQFDVIGNLDGDVTFDPGYFEFLLAKFSKNPGLGVAGTRFIEKGTSYDYRFASIEHVSGQCQLFRRECFVDIGGYIPIEGGGIDWVAVMTARMKGWTTRTYLGQVFEHHRPMGTGGANVLVAWFRQGRQDYYLGGHPLWAVLRAGFQTMRKPYVIGGVSLWLGFMHALISRTKRPISDELVQFHRREQMLRLRGLWRKALGRGPQMGVSA